MAEDAPERQPTLPQANPSPSPSPNPNPDLHPLSRPEAGAPPSLPAGLSTFGRPGAGEGVPPSRSRRETAALEDRVAGSIRERGCGFYAAVAGITVLVLVLVTAVLTGWWYRHNFHAKPFTPVVLTEKEQKVLDVKLDTLGVEPEGSRRAPSELVGMRPVPPPPQAPAEEERLEQASRERRTIVITEKEINAILNHNTDLEERVKIRFHDGGVGGEAIIDFPEDAPFVGGKTVRTKVTVATHLDINGGLVIIVDDVTVNGVPVPNAWLGEIKGKNLMEDYENRDPFLRALANGIEDIEARDGELRIILAK